MILPLVIVFGFVLGILHYFSDRIFAKLSFRRMKTISFTAGIFIAYVFLHLFPQLYGGGEYMFRISMVFVIIGFSFFHVIEKYIYKHTLSTDKLKVKLKREHSVTFFLYHLIIGMVLVNAVKADIINGVLFFIPIVSYTAMSSVSLKEIYRVKEQKGLKFVLSASTLIGILLASVMQLTPLAYHVLLGFVIGSLLFLIFVDSIPKEREGKPLFFILGLVLYAVVIGLTWII